MQTLSVSTRLTFHESQGASFMTSQLTWEAIFSDTCYGQYAVLWMVANESE